MSSRTKALLAIVAASLLWSTAGLSKIIVRTLDPFTAAFLRFFIASLVMVPFFLREKYRSKTLLRDLGPLSLASALNVGLFYLGIRTSTASSATLIYAGVPLVTMLLANRVIGEKVTAKKLLGIIIGLVGVFTIVILPKFETGHIVSGDFRGNLFYLTAVITWSFYTVASRRAISQKGYSPITISAMSIFISAAFFGLIVPFTLQPAYLTVLARPMMILLILHLAIVITVMTYLLFQWAIQHSSATTVSLKQYLEPVFAILFNVTFLGESITRGFFLGSLLVFVGVIIATGSSVVSELKKWQIPRGWFGG